MVRVALDRIPEEFRKALESVAIVISDKGVERHAYGEYWGDGFARDNYPDRIVIFRDTLVRDFGHDRKRLAAEVERIVWPWIAAGKVKPQVDRTFPLAEAAAAHAHVEGGAHVGKVVLSLP